MMLRDMMIQARVRRLLEEGWDGYAAHAWAVRQVDAAIDGFAKAVAKAVAMFEELADALRVAIGNAASGVTGLARVGWWSFYGGDGLTKAERARERRLDSMMRLRDRRAQRRARRATAWHRNHRLA